MIFFTADQHFFHKSIIKSTNRPWTTLEDMHRGLIRNWNARVTCHDIVYCIGDFALSNNTKSIKALLSRLNGKIMLVPGNHDSKALRRLMGGSGGLLDSVYILNENSYKIVMCHYPLLQWPGSNYNSICLCGHSHGNLSASNPHDLHRSLIMDVGVDCNNYAPVSMDEVLENMEWRKELYQ